MAKLLRKYTKKSKYSLCFGVYPTIELLTHRPESIQSIFIRSDAVKNGGAQRIKDFCSYNRIPYHINNKAIMNSTGKENIYALAVFEKFESELEKGRSHVLLVNPAGAGNVGTIIRTMDGFGFHDIAIIRPGTDIYHPEVVRSSMGSLFRMRFEYFLSLEEYQAKYTNPLYIFTTTGETELPHAKFAQPFTLIFGNEGSGLPEETLAKGKTIRIPQSGNIDSLNLAMSAGIALYQAYTSCHH